MRGLYPAGVKTLSRECTRIKKKRKRERPDHLLHPEVHPTIRVHSWPYVLIVHNMRYLTLLAIALLVALAVWLPGQTPTDPLSDGFKLVEVASVADAMEQLYGQKAYMTHDMRPLSPAKFAGPAVTVMLKKEEHKEGSKASSG